MSRNGTGTYVLPAGQPVVTLTSISSTVFNTLTTDLANALTTSVATDGQSAMTGNLNLGTHKITNLAAGTADSDAVRLDQVLTPARYGTTSLTGQPTAATPLTKYDINAIYIELTNSVFHTIVFGNPGTLTCDLGLAGPIINGRDQAGAFSVNTWIYIYFISNGSTIASIASTNSFAPVLPSGYTYWCLATAIFWNAASNIVPCRTRGSKVFWSPKLNVLAAGTATVETAIGITAVVAPNAKSFFGRVQDICTSAGGGAGSNNYNYLRLSDSKKTTLDD